MAKPASDTKKSMTTTGHEWDGIEELNNPLPRWWLWVFYATIVFAIGYWFAYPAWPTLTAHTQGLLGYSSRADVTREVDALKAMRTANAAGITTASLDEIAADPALRSFAVALGKAAFGSNCSGCHGTGAAGAVGYPNLNDDDWLWGGKLADIHQTILHGVRNESPDSRQPGVPAIGMPAFGRDGTLTKQQMVDAAAFARSLSGLPAEEGGNVEAGKALFAEQCAGCHGEDGKGIRDVGGPNLTDGIWLYGSDTKTILEGLQNGRAGVMPSWAQRLDETTTKSLAVYIHTLGGGEK
jgi:cytochrome c oxidase cbb3-type subunit 3